MKKPQRMRLGGVYVNAWAGETNPHRVGLYTGKSGKLFEILHADGTRSAYDDTEALVYGGVQIFDRGSLRNWFQNCQGRTKEAADKLMARLHRKNFPESYVPGGCLADDEVAP